MRHVLRSAACGIVCALSLSACSPTEQVFDSAQKDIPNIEDNVFHAADSAELSSRQWLPEKNPKAIIVALHGMNDYSHSFERSGVFFSKNGIAVYAYDQRGFGASPNAGIWGGESNFVRDLEQYISVLKAQYPHVPMYVLGESMGGAVAIVATSDPSFPKINGVILSAPAVWGAETIPLLYRSTLWVGAHTLPYKLFTGRDLKIIASDNYPMLRALAADPLVIKGTRVDAVYGVVHLMDSAYEKVPQMKTPVLLLYGANDQVIPPYPIKNALRRFSIPIEYAYYPKGYHMLLRDLQSQVVMGDILSWIKQPKHPLPSGFGKLKTPKDASTEK